MPDVRRPERFERLGVTFQKRLHEGRMNYVAFIRDPDDYWIEICSRRRCKTDGHCHLSTPAPAPGFSSIAFRLTNQAKSRGNAGSVTLGLLAAGDSRKTVSRKSCHSQPIHWTICFKITCCWRSLNSNFTLNPAR